MNPHKTNLSVVAMPAVALLSLLVATETGAVIGAPPPRLLAAHDGGLPQNLLDERTVLSPRLLESIAASLPERQDLAQAHPDLIKKDWLRNLHFTGDARVTVTFVHEGTSKLNAAGMFRYPTSKPPVLPFDVERIVLFPNASLKGGGGKLESGHSIAVGDFKSGESMGFFLISDGFNRGEVTEGSWTVYSVDELNAAGYFGTRAHTVLLDTKEPGRFIVGFEDVLRTRTSDHDFNDVLLMVAVDPPGAVATDGYGRLLDPDDADRDGIASHEDDYPTDPQRAFRADYPKKGKHGVIAYEDSWPAKGDYDFNDLVVSYHVIEARNAEGRLVDAEIVYEVLAVGAAGGNGLAVRLPVKAADIREVTRAVGGESPQSWHLLRDQENATVVVFADAFDMIKPPEGYSFANTELGSPPVKAEEVRLRFFFEKPLPTQALGSAPYDTFLFKDDSEVHLPGHPPSDTIDRGLFQTGDDATDLASGYTFKTAQGLPWALLVPEAWRHPCERVPIDESYHHFADWAATAGREHRTWYEEPSTIESVWSALATSPASQ